MTRLEEWEYQITSLAQALIQKKELCEKDKCVNRDKPNAFCEHFDKIYHGLWNTKQGENS